MNPNGKIYPEPGTEMNPDIKFRLGRRIYGIEIYQLDEDSKVLASGSDADPEYQRGWADARRRYTIDLQPAPLEWERETIIRIRAGAEPGEYMVEGRDGAPTLTAPGLSKCWNLCSCSSTGMSQSPMIPT